MRFKFALVGVLMLSAMIAAAQAPFTILRPVNGAKVRENVRIEIPRRSIPPGGYIGIYLDGAFVEAVAPNDEAKPTPTFRYFFDTKARKIEDGPHTFRVVLYGGEPSRELDSSEVKIVVANNDVGLKKGAQVRLRYKWSPGATQKYRFNSKVFLISASREQVSRGSTPTELLLSNDTFTFEVNPIRTLSGNSYVLRSQILPPVFDDENGQKVWVHDSRLMSADQVVNSLGLNTLVMAPAYYAGWNPTAQGIAGSPSMEGLLFLPPWPNLPVEPVGVGDQWLARLKMNSGPSRITNARVVENAFENVQATGKLMAFEWIKGYRVARLNYVLIQERPRELLRFTEDIALRQAKLTFEENIWFAFDSGKLVRLEKNVDVEGLAADISGMGQPGGPGPSSSGGGGPRSLPPPGGGGSRSLPPPGALGGGGQPGPGGVPAGGDAQILRYRVQTVIELIN